jgi:hypothetical protein
VYYLAIKTRYQNLKCIKRKENIPGRFWVKVLHGIRILGLQEDICAITAWSPESLILALPTLPNKRNLNH